LRQALCAALLGLCLAASARAAGDNGAVSQPDLRWHLTGVIIGPHVNEALFGTDTETRVVPLGAELDGWTLAEIRLGSVTLRRQGEEKRLGADEWLPDDERAADSVRRLQQFEAQSAASAALQQQRDDQANAETSLTQATEEMQRAKPQ
jgi:hypothetical protein